MIVETDTLTILETVLHAIHPALIAEGHLNQIA